MFTPISKDDPTIVGDSMSTMNKLAMGVSDFEVNEYHSAMLNPSVNISRFIFHSSQIVKKKIKK